MSAAAVRAADRGAELKPDRVVTIHTAIIVCTRDNVGQLDGPGSHSMIRVVVS